MTARRSPLRHLTRILLGALFLVTAGIGAFCWWFARDGEEWLRAKARERLNEVVWKASVPGYHFSVDSVLTDPWNGDLRLIGLHLDHDSALTDSLRNGAYRYLFAADADLIHLHGLSYWRLVLLREFHARSITLHGPRLRYTFGEERVGLRAPFERLRAPGRAPLAIVSIDSLRVSGAQTTVHDLGGRLPVLRIAGLGVEAADVRIVRGDNDDRADLRTGVVELSLDSLNAEVAGTYRLHIGPVHLSGLAHAGAISDLSLHPLDSAVVRDRRSTMDIRIAALSLHGLDIGQLIADQALELSSLTLTKPWFSDRLDKRIPVAAEPPIALPPAALRDLGFLMRIDTVHIVDGTILHAENAPRTDAWARLSFTGMQATIIGIDNTPRQGPPRPGIDATIACTFLDSADLRATYHAAPDISEAFSFEATVLGLPMQQLDPVTRPLVRLAVNGGDLDRMHLLMKGNDDRARATMELSYTGLHASVVRDATEEERHSLFGDLLDHVLDADNGGGLSDAQRRSYAVERDKQRSLLTYIWHVTRTGLKRDLVPGVKERVGLLLKKDREERRQRRDRRKGG